MKMIRKCFKYLFLLYAAFAILLLTALILLISYNLITKHFRCVEFPNQTRLCPTELYIDRIALMNSDGGILLKPQVMEISWNKEYIFGRRLISPNGASTNFIYKKGWFEAKEYIDHDQYRKACKKFGITNIIRRSNNTFTNTDKTYWGLIKNSKFILEWYDR